MICTVWCTKATHFWWITTPVADAQVTKFGMYQESTQEVEHKKWLLEEGFFLPNPISFWYTFQDRRSIIENGCDLFCQTYLQHLVKKNAAKKIMFQSKYRRKLHEVIPTSSISIPKISFLHIYWPKSSGSSVGSTLSFWMNFYFWLINIPLEHKM